jgi:hypothetical protein
MEEKTGSRPIVSPKILQKRFEEELRRRLRAKKIQEEANRKRSEAATARRTDAGT